MKYLPPLPAVAPKPEEKMAVWQQYQRLRFEYKERGLPLDGSYKPPVPDGPPTRPPLTGLRNDPPSGLYRSVSTPQFDKGAPGTPQQSRMGADRKKQLGRQTSNLSSSMSGMPSAGSQGWAWAATPGGEKTRPKSGSFAAPADGEGPRDAAVVLFENALRYVKEERYAQGAAAFGQVISNALAQRALCLIKLKDFEGAIGECNAALTYDKENARALVRKAHALAVLEMVEEAKILRFTVLKHLKEDDPEVKRLSELLGFAVPPSPVASDGSDAEPIASPTTPMSAQRRRATTQQQSPSPSPAAQQQLQQPKRLAGSISGGESEDEANALPDAPAAPIPPPRLSVKDVNPVDGAEPPGNGSVAAVSNETGLSSSGTVASLRGSGRTVRPNIPAPEPPGGRGRGRGRPGSLAPSITKPLPVPPQDSISQKDPLDESLDYATMEELPPLPGDPPAVDEDLGRWQQYQRLKAQYKERGLEPKFVQ
jgi:hypothetical protein